MKSLILFFILLSTHASLAKPNDTEKANKAIEEIIGNYVGPTFPTGYGGEFKPTMEISKSTNISNAISFKIFISSEKDGSFGPARDSRDAIYEENEGFVFRDPEHHVDCKIIIKSVENRLSVEDPLEKCQRQGSAMQVRHKLEFTRVADQQKEIKKFHKKKSIL